MGHGSRRLGEVVVFALCDGIARSSNPIDESFPGVSEDDWRRYRRAFPDAFADDGRWRFHVHAFVIRSDDTTVLVDTGAGPANDWAPECGRLREELRASAIGADEVDVVVLTHFHDDHIGWAVTEGGSPAFPNARYAMHAGDWELLGEEDDPEALPYRDRLLQPLRDAAVLDFVEDGHRLAPWLEVHHTPGHTPGHISVLVESAGGRLLVAGDVLNHPGQIADRFPSGSDGDPDLAAETRERVLSRAERERIVLSTAHLREPFGRVELEEGRRVWRPVA